MNGDQWETLQHPSSSHVVVNAFSPSFSVYVALSLNRVPQNPAVYHHFTHQTANLPAHRHTPFSSTPKGIIVVLSPSNPMVYHHFPYQTSLNCWSTSDLQQNTAIFFCDFSVNQNRSASRFCGRETRLFGDEGKVNLWGFWCVFFLVLRGVPYHPRTGPN